jgi:hypothetical protein
VRWEINNERNEYRMTKEDEIMNYLHKHVFDPVLNSLTASNELKSGVRLTITRLRQQDAKGMINYFWAAITGTERSNNFAKKMKQEGFDRFEEVFEDFREKFNDKWLNV